MKRLLMLLALIPALSFATARSNAIFLTLKGENGAVILKKNISASAKSSKNLDLGESVDKSILTLEGPNSGDLNVEYQLESTLGLNDEGPHLDLHKWKHGISDWKPLDKKNTGVFLLPDEIVFKDFPAVTPEEIQAAVKKYGTEKWINLSKQCKSVNEYPCHVGVSQIRLRVQRGEKTIHTAILVTPMGC